MPQISKVRIVNFNYNDGNRLIADELFDFSNKDQTKARNVLISLGNGGGKSVLVQLMMQPIIPKAKVAGRKIESFFKKSSDHCFILLEWIKDNSPEKLMTGISMAAGGTLASENETARGQNVKYYTFYSEYREESSPYSIVNLPLSEKQKGKFVPADYPKIKELSKKSGGILGFYASDDQRKWREYLLQFGISQDEWHVIEGLNVEEGGLGKYFEKLNTSDRLIDHLMIPTIERKVMKQQPGEDHSIVTMLLNYTKEYASKKEILRQKELYSSFQKTLTDLEPLTEKLYDCNEQLEKAQSELASYFGAIEKAIQQIAKQQQENEKKKSDLAGQETHIQWEEASANYYQKKELYEKAFQELTLVQQKGDILKSKLDAKDLEIRILNCADYYQQIQQLEAEIFAIREKIRQQESGSDGQKELDSLKYSAFHAVCKELEIKEPEYADWEMQKASCEAELQEKKAEKDQAEQKKEKTHDERISAESKLGMIRQDTDEKIQKLHLEISRRLDGFYAQNELNELKSEKEKQYAAFIQNKEQCEKQRSNIQDSIEAIPQQIADVRFEQSENQRELEQKEKELQKYYRDESDIEKICQQYSVDFSLRFTDYLRKTIREEQNASTAKIAANIRKASVQEEEIEAVQRGSLHVPNAVIEYLNAAGVRYSTCEKYLLEQVKEGKLTQERCLEILQKYPAAAYGVLIEEAEKERLFSYDREKWLPAIIPLFTYQQMEKILAMEKEFTGSIAFYSEEYFADAEHYLDRLNQNKKDLESEREFLENQRETLNSQQEIISHFTYSESWAAEQQSAINHIQEKIAQCEKNIQDLSDKERSLKEERSRIALKCDQMQKEIACLERFIEAFADLPSQFQKETQAYELQIECRKKAESAEADFQKLSAEYLAISEKLRDISDRIEELQKEIRELHEVKEKTEGCKPADIRDGNWKDLYLQYQELQKSFDAEISELESQQSQKLKQKQNLQGKISMNHLQPEQYELVTYSIEKEDKAKKEKDLLSSDYTKAQAAIDKASRQEAVAEYDFNGAKEQLLKYNGEALPFSEVGTDFEVRILEIRQEIEKISGIQKNNEKISWGMQKILREKSGKQLGTSIVAAIQLAENFEDQYQQLNTQCEANRNTLRDQHDAVHRILLDLQNQFSESDGNIQGAVRSMVSILENKQRGDRYYTLFAHVQSVIQSTGLYINKVITDLKEVENSRTDLVHHCFLLGRQIYDGLQQMQNSSRVTVYEGRDKKNMIRFDIPEEIDSVIAENSIAAEIENGTSEIVALMENSSFSEVELKKKAEQIVSSQNLLRKYVGKDSIIVRAYKIDQNANNGTYRTWEETGVNNSGAEKFVVYFAVILSLMNYTRQGLGVVRDKELRSSLILDNPFGATTSRHILIPMFKIAEQFRVQMICLSGINEPDVMNRFDIVIKAIVKQRPMSNHELLTHEGNEEIEHGFYRSEMQMTLI